MTDLKLSDEFIAQLVNVLQLAIISGTDIIDHLRMMRLVESDGSITMSSEYQAIFNSQIDTMLEEVNEMQEKMSEDLMTLHVVEPAVIPES